MRNMGGQCTRGFMLGLMRALEPSASSAACLADGCADSSSGRFAEIAAMARCPLAPLRMGNYIRGKRDMHPCSGYASERCFKACRCRIGGHFASCGCDPPSGTNSGSRPGIQCIGRQWQASRDIAVDRKSCGDPIARRARGYQLWQTPRLREARFGGVPVLLEGRPRKTHNDAERIVLFMGPSGAGKARCSPFASGRTTFRPALAKAQL